MKLEQPLWFVVACRLLHVAQNISNGAKVGLAKTSDYRQYSEVILGILFSSTRVNRHMSRWEKKISPCLCTGVRSVTSKCALRAAQMSKVRTVICARLAARRGARKRRLEFRILSFRLILAIRQKQVGQFQACSRIPEKYPIFYTEQTANCGIYRGSVRISIIAHSDCTGEALRWLHFKVNYFTLRIRHRRFLNPFEWLSISQVVCSYTVLSHIVSVGLAVHYKQAAFVFYSRPSDRLEQIAVAMRN